jgi:uncharacterized protein (TIGR00369 family)
MLPAGTYYTSQDLSIKFLHMVTTSTGPLQCEGTVIHLGSRTALAQATVTDGVGRQYAHATSSCLIFRPGPAADARASSPSDAGYRGTGTC